MEVTQAFLPSYKFFRQQLLIKALAEKNRVAENTIEFIDNQLKSVTDSLTYSESRFTNFRTRTQSIDLSQEGGIVMQKKETLESERAIRQSRKCDQRSKTNDGSQRLSICSTTC